MGRRRWVDPPTATPAPSVTKHHTDSGVVHARGLSVGESVGAGPVLASQNVHLDAMFSAASHSALNAAHAQALAAHPHAAAEINELHGHVATGIDNPGKSVHFMRASRALAAAEKAAAAHPVAHAPTPHVVQHGAKGGAFYVAPSGEKVYITSGAGGHGIGAVTGRGHIR